MKYVTFLITLVTISITSLHGEETVTPKYNTFFYETAQSAKTVFHSATQKMNTALQDWHATFKTLPLFEIEYESNNISLISKIKSRFKNYVTAHPYRMGITGITAIALMSGLLTYKSVKQCDKDKGDFPKK